MQQVQEQHDDLCHKRYLGTICFHFSVSRAQTLTLLSAWLLWWILHRLRLRRFHPNRGSSLPSPLPSTPPSCQCRQERCRPSQPPKDHLRHCRHDPSCHAHQLRCHALHASICEGFTERLVGCWVVWVRHRVWRNGFLLWRRFGFLQTFAGKETGIGNGSSFKECLHDRCDSGSPTHHPTT